MKARLLFLLFALISLSASGQRFFDIYETGDTLTNQDTLIYLTTHNGGPANIDVPYYYSIHVQADSISGANAGFAYLQFSNHRSGTTWYTAQTLTIDGTTTDEALWEGICYARKVRVYYITPSGTRKVRAKVYASFKRMN